MSLGKKLFIGSSAAGACPTDSVQPFGADSAYSSNVALYQLDSDGGTTNNVPDTVGNYNGTATNVTYSTGKYGNAANFSGTNYITVTGITSTSTFSYSLWVKPTNASSSGFKGIFGKQSTEGQLFTDSGALKIFTNTTQTFTGSPTLSDNVWSHIVLSVSNGTGTIYVNGIDKGTSTGISLPSTLYMGTASTQIGVSTYGYQGLIDQARIYDKALSSDEVGVLYNETTDTVSDHNVLSSGGVALYSLDYDASDAGGNYDGSPQGGVSFGYDGNINYSAYFDGNYNSEIVVEDNLMDSYTTFSISFWCKGNQQAANFSGLFNKATLGASGFVVDIPNASNGKPRILFYSGSTYYLTTASTTSVTDGDWHHISAVVDGSSSLKIYIDGNLEGTNSSINTMTTNTNNLTIGVDGSNTFHWKGYLDQIRIFKKALLQSEVDTLYAETACVYTSTTDTIHYQGTNLAYYKLDNNALDETTNYDGTEYNITYDFGRYGTAAVFNGSSSYIQTTLSPSFGVISHSLWFYADSADSTNFLYYFDNRGGRIDVAITGTGSNSISASFESVSITATTATSQFNHLSLVYTGWASSYSSGSYGGAITVTAYLNGSPIGTATPTPYGQTTGMRIGRSGGSYHFEGKIDQVRIYNSALDATAVENLYNEKQAYITKNASDPFGDGDEVAFYKLENNANDSTGSNTGAAYNVTFTSGSGLFETYAAEFNGSSSYIDVGLDIHNNSVNGLTYSFWAYWGNSTFGNAISGGSTNGISGKKSNRQSVVFNKNSERFDYLSREGVYCRHTTSLSDGWHHFAVTDNSAGGTAAVKMYIDGQDVSFSSPTASTGYSTNTDLQIGRGINNSGGWSYFDGSLDQVRIFDRALDGDEVFKLYAEVIN